MTTRSFPRPYEAWRADEADRAEDAANLFGHFLMRHCRDEALSRLPAQADPAWREAAETAVDRALHNLTELLEGFWELRAGHDHTAELALHVNIRKGETLVESIPISPLLLDLPIGYWSWREPSAALSCRSTAGGEPLNSSTPPRTAPNMSGNRSLDTPSANWPQSAGAVLIGWISIVFLSLATDHALQLARVLPGWGQPVLAPGLNLLALGYRCAFAILGSYLAARLSPRHPMRHAMTLGLLGLLLSLLGALTAHQNHFGPIWYPLALAAAALPCAWLGALLARPRQA